jgi:hypothetical protein
MMHPIAPAPDTLSTLQQDVATWHQAAWPADIPDHSFGTKLLEEMDEWLGADGPEKAEEAADLLIVLCAWASRRGVDLVAQARAKLHIVRNRDQPARDRARRYHP